jgi:hypothetical protein
VPNVAPIRAPVSQGSDHATHERARFGTVASAQRTCYAAHITGARNQKVAL